MIDLGAARELLDFGRRLGNDQRADEQLSGAVAIHNILVKHRVAYLADEVGMGKTFVALGVLALFRHFDPGFRALVIAPRENIQRKWQKELSNFAAHNVRFADMRVVSLDGRPARAMVTCGNLVELIREVSLDPNRDFFVRMSSFSLALGGSGDDWKRMRDNLRRHLPWLRDDAFDLRSKEAFKANFARALCCALPRFDLVIVDEGHNLKHGFSMSGSARNQVLAYAFGRHTEGDAPDPRLFPGYGPRAERVLFLSATPLEESYRHVWNQLDLFGFGGRFPDLRRDDLDEELKKATAAQFMVRRVTAIRIGGLPHTKNMYRREWRSGGVGTHDDPINVEDPRARLVVALIQKKVSELLRTKKFNHSFQIGMLASFESFLETARLKREDDETVFDDSEQTDVVAERDGIDVHDVNRLARHYRKTFGSELPHPKMDAVVESLSTSWLTGNKALIFVRRVASVKELKRKLDERYDAWLIPTLRGRLPATMRGELDGLEARYRREQNETGAKDASALTGPDSTGLDIDDRGGHDTFFAWFFRGDGPKGVVSGADIQARFTKSTGAFATFFADNHVMDLLDARPGGVVDALATAVGLARGDLVGEIRKRAARYLSKATVATRGARMEASQGAALELLGEQCGVLAVRAKAIWEERYRASLHLKHAVEAPPEIATPLERPTFFTELRLPRRASLRERIWPEMRDARTERDWVRDREQRGVLLATAARLGHALLDLYVVAMSARSSLFKGQGEDVDEGEGDERLIAEYLDLLDRQRETPSSPSRAWGAFDELAAIATNYDLIVDVNAPELRTIGLAESARHMAGILRRQQPIGGMAGQVNQTLVRQFRMPGYPFVLVTTDLLQEGEDLHTFCSAVHHYGISWTPSSMEQRTGRIDRVRSQADRRLSAIDAPTGNDWLQVFYPYLADTVEVLQVERVLERMNNFLRLMHEGLSLSAPDQRRIDVSREMVAKRPMVAPIEGVLRSAFPVQAWALVGSKRALAVDASATNAILARFEALRRAEVPLGDYPIRWVSSRPGTLLGTAHLASGRVQPFTLLLRSHAGRPLVRCVSPIGRTDPATDPDAILANAARCDAHIGAILTRDERSYDLTVEDDVLLAAPEHDRVRVGMLLRRVVEQADWMEREQFDDGRDVPMEDVNEDLRGEGADGD